MGLILSCYSKVSDYPRLWLMPMTGNNKLEFVQDSSDSSFFLDPVDDTLNFKRVKENFYKDKQGKIYLLTQKFCEAHSDTFLNRQYFKDMSDFIDIESYKSLGNGYFINKGKVYIWRGNSCGEYPDEVEGADHLTFRLLKISTVDAEDKYGRYFDGQKMKD